MMTSKRQKTKNRWAGLSLRKGRVIRLETREMIDRCKLWPHRLHFELTRLLRRPQLPHVT